MTEEVFVLLSQRERSSSNDRGCLLVVRLPAYAHTFMRKRVLAEFLNGPFTWLC